MNKSQMCPQNRIGCANALRVSARPKHPHKKIVLLGSTGSIGTQSLDICRNMGYRVHALAAGSNVKLLEQQVREFSPQVVVVADESKYSELKTALADLDVTVLAGQQSVCQVAASYSADAVINAVVGIAGLRPTLAALGAGNQLALANKEALITGGELVMKAAAEKGITIAPVDSEHSAIFQSMLAGERKDVSGVVLTASGGPFAGKTKDQLQSVTREDALAHPNWSMGSKISIDSATLMNKGLEFIEAMWLFELTPDQIEITVHRQSILHSAVEFNDGSVIGQMSVPDMRSAIQYALTYPRRHSFGGKRLSFSDIGTLTFERPDLDTFLCLDTCIKAARAGGLAACIANGANEAAVELFLQNKIKFLQLGELVAGAVADIKITDELTLEAIEQADKQAREYVKAKIK